MGLIKKKIIEGSIRHVVGWGAGALVAKGMFDPETANQLGEVLIGLLMGLSTWYWSYKDKTGLVVDEEPAPLVATNTSQPVQPKPAASFKKGFKLSERSLNELRGVHPDLVQVIKRGISASPYDFTVTDGLRTQEEQYNYYYGDPKRSWTLRSKHLKQSDGHSHAVDLAVLTGGYLHEDLNELSAINDHLQRIASEVGIELIWGGNAWEDKVDGYHWEIKL